MSGAATPPEIELYVEAPSEIRLALGRREPLASRRGAARRLAGRRRRRSFGTVCHGAGRVLSRTNARKDLAEEAPFAYKDVERVVAVVERAGLARRVAQLRPPGVVKG